jgi:hypothetical protein
VDLNPVRAGMAPTPEAAPHTSAFERIQGQQAEARRASKGRGPSRTAQRSTGKPGTALPGGWLCPVDVHGDPLAVAQANAHRRASNKGFLSMSLADYLQILDWTGRQVRGDKRGAIPADLAPILERIGMSSEYWLETVTDFGRLFHRAAGRVSSLVQEATRAGKRWFQGHGDCRQAFA